MIVEGYKIVAPDGRELTVTQEIYESFDELVRRRCHGSVTVTFRNGGVIGVESAMRKIYK